MVIPCGVAAAQAAGAGATALGLGMGKTDLDLTRDLFKLQMQQAKRLWTADYAENAVRHGEALLQSAQQHIEAQAISTATYFQAEKIAAQSFKLAMNQDSRAYEMSWRAEVRESLRDELTNQNNRFNIVMLCDTVCLGCVFSLVAEAGVPTSSSSILLNLYVLTLGSSVGLFSISLWCAIIVVRRLHDHTAATLERKLFAQSDDLQNAWRHQIVHNLPTGPNEMHLVNMAYEHWVQMYLDPIGKLSIHLLSVGVVAMFVTAGILTHLRYTIEYDNAIQAAGIFWATVVITCGTVIAMKVSEDRKEKQKVGVYDNAWQDSSTLETGPFAKIIRTAEELSSNHASELASSERVERLDGKEQLERKYCAKTKSLHQRVESIRSESKHRSKIRQDVLTLLTTAAEELDSLPEELTSGLNKMLHSIDEADRKLASMIAMKTENMPSIHATASQDARQQKIERPSMPLHPIDAQRLPVSLVSLRQKLGVISHTSLIRVRNISSEPLRLKSGVQLKDGKYIKSLNTTDANGNNVCHYLYPGTEIPPWTEVAVAARNKGGLLPRSGISGTIVYTNLDETWSFRISFRNELISGVRKCQVEASFQDKLGDSSTVGDGNDTYWKIRKDEIDRKANSEVVIMIEQLRGEDAAKAEEEEIIVKSGVLLKNKAFGLRLQWYKRWFELTPSRLTWSSDTSGKQRTGVNVEEIRKVQRGNDLVHSHVLDIHLANDTDALRLSAASSRERDDWIKKLVMVAGIPMSESTEGSDDSSIREGIEVVQSPDGTEFFPV